MRVSSNTKRYGWLLLIVIAHTIVISSGVFGSETARLRVIIEDIQPDPIEPGHEMTIRVRVFNDGNSVSPPLQVTEQLDSALIITGQSSSFESIGTLCAGCSITNTYYVSVSQNASTGIYPIRFELTQQGSSSVLSAIRQIRVIGSPDVLVQVKSEHIDQMIRPGQAIELPLTISNVGTGTAHRIRITPDSDVFTEVGSNTVFIERLSTTRSMDVHLTLVTAPDVTPGTYSVPIVSYFRDMQGHEFTVTNFVGIQIGHAAELSVQNLRSRQTERLQVGNHFQLQSRIENVGQGDAYDVTVYLDTPLRGTTKIHLGRVRGGTDRPAVFDLYANRLGTIPHTMRITYHDDFGSYEVVYDFSFPIYVNAVFIGLMAIIIISAIGVSIVIIRRRRS